MQIWKNTGKRLRKHMGFDIHTYTWSFRKKGEQKWGKIIV